MINFAGLNAPGSWLFAVGFALVWLGLMLFYSPVADRLATKLFSKPPTLNAFKVIQGSRSRLAMGIAAAWALSALEEIVLRGIILNSIEKQMAPGIGAPAAAVIGIIAAAIVALVAHLYQGPRAAVTVAQLSVLFGALFVFSGYNLWSVIICHGLYDTVAFVMFAGKRSKYSDLPAA